MSDVSNFHIFLLITSSNSTHYNRWLLSSGTELDDWVLLLAWNVTSQTVLVIKRNYSPNAMNIFMNVWNCLRFNAEPFSFLEMVTRLNSIVLSDMTMFTWFLHTSCRHSCVSQITRQAVCSQKYFRISKEQTWIFRRDGSSLVNFLSENLWRPKLFDKETQIICEKQSDCSQDIFYADWSHCDIITSQAEWLRIQVIIFLEWSL